ncbi:trophoblast glycoprotein-like [Acipenser oxyrinchus oxyrinchus]|uniref:Trophoblast glycoprotein-like n=1 Tax=Acipenser oxyrinchus oxyrinchus TaxID=40147 RepID=A0AAD8LKC8_ACIOX|nr:trophoblast glycoprotein-like [Acipenser oxyrinchus oxyrinchus]
MLVAGPLFYIKTRPPYHKKLNHFQTGLVIFLHVLVSAQATTCPQNCECSGLGRTVIVKCVNKDLNAIPQPLPLNVKTLFITGNDIPHLKHDAFPQSLDQLTNLNLSRNKIEVIDPFVFAKMPSLKQLDLSNNRIYKFSPKGFSTNNVLHELNLSSTLFNNSFIEEISALVRNETLVNLVRLELSGNGLVYLPEDMFTSLPNLKTLALRNNSIVNLKNGTFKNLRLKSLDMRENSLKELSNATMDDFDQQPGISIQLVNNAWVCDCNIEDLLVWLGRSDAVLDKGELSCAFPDSLRDTRLLEVNISELHCPFYKDMKSVLQTSYVFLGIVLALIGVIFLLVLYLNRKGIKKWIYNIRDACRDHMEGYHYRYEISTDPRLTNLSLNPEV